MNTLVEAVNSTGQAFVDFALPMLVQTSVLILVVLVMNLVLRRRVRATFRYWIWMLVLVKFVLPPSLWSPVSIGSWFGDELETPTAAVYEAVEAQPVEPLIPDSLPLIARTFAPSIPPNVEPSGPAPFHDPIAAVKPQPILQSDHTEPGPDPSEGPFAASQPVPAPNINWQGFILLGWAAVALALLLLLLQRALFVVDLIAQAEPAPASLRKTLDDCCIRMGLTQKTGLKVSPNAVSPAVCGLFSPTILIPTNVIAKLSPQDLQAVLLHELAHVRRADLWINLLQTLLQIVYFYNPLLWLANAMIRRVREKAVDETVLVAMGETARRYPETLLTVAKLAFKRRPALSLRLIGVVESKSLLTSRIKHILGRPIPESAKLSLPGLAVVLLIAAILLPMAKARPLTERAANIWALARQEARRLNHTYIGTEHILLALAKQDESISAKVLNNLGITIDALRAEIIERLKPGPEPVTRTRLQHTAAAKRIMRHARREARALHHDYIGTEHMLLGLMNESDSVAAEVLADLDVTRQQIRGGILTLIQPGNRTLTQNDSDNDEILSADESKSRRVFLPDLETSDVDVVLDLASGQMLSAEPMERDRNHFAKLGKGDIAYEHAQNRDGLLCLRGARMQRRTENGLESLPPDITRKAFVVYFIEAPGERYQVTTAEGQTFAMNVVSIDQGDSGGALVEFREVESALREYAKEGTRIILPDVDTQSVMLDLASRQLVTVPSNGPAEDIVKAIRDLGRGDIVYDTRSLVLVRDATSPQAEKTPGLPVAMYSIGENVPETFTVTTAEARTYEITILAIDEGRNCTLEYSLPSNTKNIGKGVAGGIVVDLNGQPVVGAQVALCSETIGATVMDGRLFQPQTSDMEKGQIVETDARGVFQFEDEMPADCSLIAAHDSGFAIIELNDFEKSNEIRLTRWGCIEGQLASGRTASGDKIWMSGLPNVTWLEHRREFRYETLCDNEGRFAFKHVPAGRFEVGYLASTGQGASLTSRTPVEVKPGQTTTIRLGGEGRPVIGKFAPPEGYHGSIYFDQGLRSLVTTRPEEPRPNNYDQMTRREQQKWRAQWRQTPEAKAFYEAMWSNPNWRQYCFTIQEDGSFRIEDVIPGTYDLTVWLEEPFSSQGPPEEIGGYHGTVEVPEMAEARSDEPLDLGELTLRMKNPVHIGDTAAAFQAKTLENQDIHLADYRGQYVLLCFWSPTFDPELDRLKELYADYEGTGQLQIIGLGGADTLAEVRSHVSEHEIEWPQIYFGPDWNARLLSDLGGQMQIMLIDPKGKIVATWLREDKLTDTVRQTVGEPRRDSASHASSADGDPVVEAKDCMKLLGLAAALYANEHDGMLPDTLEPLEHHFRKPGTFAWVQEHVTYTGKDTVRKSPNAYAVMTGYETTPHPTGQRYVTFLDGHVALVEADRFKELTATIAETSDRPASALQQRIDAAEPGSVMMVPKGTFTKPIRITKPVTLRGASQADCVLEVTADEPAISVNTAGQGGVALENLTVRWQLASQDRVERPFALHVKDTKVVVRNCRITGMGDYRRSPIGVNFEGSPKAALDGCHLAGFEYVVCVRAGTEAIVEDCFITDCGHQGVINYSGTTMRVRRCVITGSKYHAVRCTGGTLYVRDSLLIGNANRGIYLGNRTGQGTIINNLILGNGTGISGFGQATYAIENNVIANNKYAAISMRDFCHLSIANNVLAGNGRGAILHKEGGRDANKLITNLFWDNDQNIEDFDQAVTCLIVDPQFVDPNGGDFSVQGPAKEQGQGLTNPEIIKQLWQKLESQPQVLQTALKKPEAPPSPQPAPAQISTSGNLAWQRTDRYVPPDPKGFFPDDVEGGKRLDALFQAVDKDRRSDEEILSTVRQGFRRTKQHRTLVLRWIGNRYIWGKDPQNAEAIEIMYHAVAIERHYAVYFGLSVMKHKTPNVLRTLADLCVRGEEVGRITWGLGAQRQEIIPYIEPYLKDADEQTREIAAVLVQHFKGELDFDKWQAQKRLEHTKAQFSDQAPQIKEKLLTGDSQARRETMALIQRNQLTGLFDDSFLPAMAACATDPDRKVRNEAARMIGGAWIWRPGEQDPNAVALMLKLASDEDREVRYNAVYFGLSVVRDKTEPIIHRLVELALADHENNLYGRIVWGLKGPMRANPEPLKAVLAEYVERAKADAHLAASLDALYRDVLDSAPPKDWGLGDMEEKYPRDLFVISFTSSQSFEPKNASALWSEFIRTVPKDIVVEQTPSYRRRTPEVCTAKVRGQDQVNAVKEAIEKNPNLALGQVAPVSVAMQLHLEERSRTMPAPPAANPPKTEVNEPTPRAVDQGPGPIQRRINAAAPGDTITLEPGVYEEHLVIDKPLTFQGAGWEQTTIMTRSQLADLAQEIQTVMQDRIRAATSDDERQKIVAEVRQLYKDKLNHPTLLVTGAEGVVIRGIKFSNPGQHMEGSLASLSALRISDSHVRMTDCAVLGAVGNGVHIVDDSTAEIDHTLVAATWSTGIVIGEKDTRPSRVNIHDSDIRNCHYAEIRIGAGNDQVQIERCRVSGAAWHGIRYDDASPTIQNNLIFGNARSGIYASGKTTAAIHGNLFYANEGGGMSCWFQNTDRIENNTFVDNEQLGLSIVGASKPVLRKNIFCMHPMAIAIADLREDSPWAKSDGTFDLQNNLFWDNEHDAQRYEDETPHSVPLGEETQTLRADPQFTALKDFTLTADSPAREAGIGALDLISVESPWPIQPEERAIIPDSPTRDYRQWKGKN